MFRKIILFAILSIIGPLHAGPGPGDSAGSDEVQTDGLSIAEAEGLAFMREEEKLARDVYQTLFQQWGSRIFSNIAASEQIHTDVILNLLDKYGLVDPAQPQTGAFTNHELQRLYDELTARGNQSEIEALYVGALIEEVDMRDIQEAIANAQQQDIIDVYESLLCGSRNHLRSFLRQIESDGILYAAQVLTPQELSAIADSPMERDCGR